MLPGSQVALKAAASTDSVAPNGAAQYLFADGANVGRVSLVHLLHLGFALRRLCGPERIPRSVGRLGGARGLSS